MLRVANTNAMRSVTNRRANEPERLCRFAIEPLRVVDDAQQRSFGPELRQQAQYRQPDE